MENFSYYAFVQVAYTSTIVLEIFSYYWKGNVKHEKKNYLISLKDQDYNFIATSINFQKTTLTFGEENKICPDNNCFYEFENTSFDNGFGAENSKFLSRTLKIEDKQILKAIFLYINSLNYLVCLIWLIRKKILQLEKRFWFIKVIYYLIQVMKCFIKIRISVSN